MTSKYRQRLEAAAEELKAAHNAAHNLLLESGGAGAAVELSSLAGMHDMAFETAWDASIRAIGDGSIAEKHAECIPKGKVVTDYVETLSSIEGTASEVPWLADALDREAIASREMQGAITEASRNGWRNF